MSPCRIVAFAQFSCLEVYKQIWFRTYSKPNVETATAKTYERQLNLHILPVMGDLNVEDVTPDHIQTIFNRMTGTKAMKDKARTVLNMILGMAADDREACNWRGIPSVLHAGSQNVQAHSKGRGL